MNCSSWMQSVVSGDRSQREGGKGVRRLCILVVFRVDGIHGRAEQWFVWLRPMWSMWSHCADSCNVMSAIADDFSLLLPAGPRYLRSLTWKRAFIANVRAECTLSWGMYHGYSEHLCTVPPSPYVWVFVYLVWTEFCMVAHQQILIHLSPFGGVELVTSTVIAATAGTNEHKAAPESQDGILVITSVMVSISYQRNGNCWRDNPHALTLGMYQDNPEYLNFWLAIQEVIPITYIGHYLVSIFPSSNTSAPVIGHYTT